MTMDELKNKIFGALGDPKAPWYGSDLVAWVGDYIEEAEKQLDNARDCLWGEKAGYVKGLEDENKAILRRAEAAEEDWQLAKERIKQLEGEEPFPDSWWSGCPELAQKTMERLIESNKQQSERIKELEQLLIEYGRHKEMCDIHLTDVLVETIGRPSICTCGFEQALKES